MASCHGARTRVTHGRPTADRKVDPQNHWVACLVGLRFLNFLTVPDPRGTHEIPTNRPTESLDCIQTQVHTVLVCPIWFKAGNILD